MRKALMRRGGGGNRRRGKPNIKKRSLTNIRATERSHPRMNIENPKMRKRSSTEQSTRVMKVQIRMTAMLGERGVC
jgi:hypothetical protein